MRLQAQIISLTVLALMRPDRAAAEWNAALTLCSDYVWRGWTQTDDHAALQAGADLALSKGLYAGVWGSTVDYVEDGVSDPARLELDVYAGWAGEISADWGLDLALMRYSFPRSSGDFDYSECVLHLSHGEADLELDWSPDASASGAAGSYAMLTWGHELPDWLRLGAGLGCSLYSREAADLLFGPGLPRVALNWQLSASRQVLGLDLELRYHDTDSRGETLAGGRDNARLVLAATKAFSTN